MTLTMIGADAQKSGVTAESVKAATRAQQMTIEEAEKILGIDASASYDQVLKVSLLMPFSHDLPSAAPYD